MLALSATVGKGVVETLEVNLVLRFTAVVKGDVFRPNLRFQFQYQATPLMKNTEELIRSVGLWAHCSHASQFSHSHCGLLFLRGLSCTGRSVGDHLTQSVADGDVAGGVCIVYVKERVSLFFPLLG